MTELLRDKLQKLPDLPGIYKMLNRDGQIIYIGKSKCLKNRVRSYFSKTPTWEKVKKMVNMIHDFEIIVTDTHLEARLLECELIKFYKPVFNSQFKTDSRYVFLNIENSNKYSPLTISTERKNNSYGPFRSKYTLMDAILSLENLYPLQKTNDGYAFEYQLFPSTMDKDAFLQNREILLELFHSTHYFDTLKDNIHTKMMEAASNLKYETASLYRDILHNIDYLRYGIDGFKDIMNKDIIITLPATDFYKFFYITKGIIVNKKTYKKLTKKNIEFFTNQCSGIQNKIINTLSKSETSYYSVNGEKIFLTEKMQKDFKDILYSEVLTLPKELVIYME